MDRVLVDGDFAMFQPTFGAATVVPLPGQIKGSGPATANGKKLCVEGDEGKVSVAGCPYMTPQYSIPGVGTLEISGLAGDQKAKKTKTGGKSVLLIGSRFNARFKVTVPAQQPPPGPGSPIPDSTTEYSGGGTFLGTNFKLNAT